MKDKMLRTALVCPYL